MPPPTRSFVASKQRDAVGGGGATAAAREPRSPLVDGAVQNYHMQVGKNVSKYALDEIAASLNADARLKFHQRHYEDALNIFAHALAIAEKSSGPGIHAEYGALNHNMASCLHCLGDFANAKAHCARLPSAQPRARP